MTVQILNKILKENNIPNDARLMSDSGWECDATDMDAAYYNREKNTVVFTQGCESMYHEYLEPGKWKLLYRVD